MALKTKNNDQEIISGIRAGKDSSLNQLYDLNRRSFINYVKLNSGSEEEAKDVLQDAVIIVYQKIITNQLTLTSNLNTYLTSICRNLWFKTLRERGKMVMMPVEEFEIEDETSEINPKIRLIMELLPQIDPLCQEILKQRYWYKRKFEEISVLMKNTITALKMKSSRCLEYLRKNMN